MKNIRSVFVHEVIHDFQQIAVQINNRAAELRGMNPSQNNQTL
jgi:hypothetical protein